MSKRTVTGPNSCRSGQNVARRGLPGPQCQMCAGNAKSTDLGDKNTASKCGKGRLTWPRNSNLTRKEIQEVCRRACR